MWYRRCEGRETFRRAISVKLEERGPHQKRKERKTRGEGTYVVRSRDLMDEVSADEGDLLQDIALDAGDAGGVEDDGEERDAAEEAGLEAAARYGVSLAKGCRIFGERGGFPTLLLTVGWLASR